MDTRDLRMAARAFAVAEKNHFEPPHYEEVETPQIAEYRTPEFIKDEALVEGIASLDTPNALYELLAKHLDSNQSSEAYAQDALRVMDILVRQTKSYIEHVEDFKTN